METAPDLISARVGALNAQIIGRSVPNPKLNLVSRESLLDALQALYDECRLDALQKYDKSIAQFVEKYKSVMLELKKFRVNLNDFELKKVIGRGHFGEVHLIKECRTGDIYAMKTTKKTDSLEKTSFEIEREIMALTQSQWLTSLHYAFQDTTNLYFVMEYHPGGDLLGLLYRQGGTLPESACIFYIAEISVALEDLHSMKFVHRDVKPDNVLLDRCGHVKLADFGSAARLNENGLVQEGPPVGTPDYVAPEVLQAAEGAPQKRRGYGISCDFWSLGVVAYELAIGRTPFGGQSAMTTYTRIMNHNGHLKFPPDSLLTQAYINLIKSLLSEPEKRLDQIEIRKHAVFKNLDFNSLRDQVPPYVPKITSQEDTSNFTDILPKQSCPSIENFKKRTQFSGRNLPFIGFTFTHDTIDGADGLFKVGGKTARDSAAVVESLKREIGELRRELAKSGDFMEAKVGMEKKLAEKGRKVESLEGLRGKLEKDLAGTLAENTALKRTLELERNDRTELERKALDLIKSAKIKWETAEKSKISSLNLEIEQLKLKLSESNSTNSMLNEQLQNYFKRENDHQKSLNIVEKMSRKSVIGLESRLERVTHENRTTITDLQAKLNEEIRSKQRLETELRNCRGNESTLTEKLRATQKSYENLKTKVDEAETVIDELSKLVDQFEARSKISEDNQKEIDNLKTVIDSCQLKIKNVEMKNDKLKEENKKIDSCQLEIVNLRESIMKKDKRIVELESHLVEERETITKLKADIDKCKAPSNIDDSQELRELRTKQWKVEKELGNCKIDKRILERELKDSQEQIKQLQLDLDSAKEIMAKNKKIHESALLELNAINERISLEMVKTKETCKNLRSQLDNEMEKVTNEKDMILELKNTIKVKDVKISDLNQVLSAANNEKMALQKTISAIEGEKRELLGKIESLERQQERLLGEIDIVQKQAENTKLNWEALKEACMLLESQVIEYEKISATLREEKSKMAENTEKLISDLCRAREDVQEAKKLLNEEKSLKLQSEAKVKRLNENIESLQDECTSYKSQCNQFKQCTNSLSDELTVTEEKLTDLEINLRSYERQIEELISENNLLKEEVSHYLTQIGASKDANYRLKQQISELKELKEMLKDKVAELEATLGAKMSHFHEREIKREATIQQQVKLIDYLQSKVDELSHKKRTLAEKLFGSSKKENQPPLSVALNYRDLDTQLQKQRELNRNLQQEIHRLKTNTTDNKKIDRHKSEITSPKTVKDHLQRSTTEIKKKNFNEKTAVATVDYENFTHKFETVLCKKPQNCEGCTKRINLGRNMSICKNCKISVHVNCTNSVKCTCGFVQKYQNQIGGETVASSNENIVKLEGWIKMLNDKNEWQRVWAHLTDQTLSYFNNETRQQPLETIGLKLANTKGKVVLEPLESEIGITVASTDLPFIIKLEIIDEDNLETISKSVLMTLTMDDRDRWFKGLEGLFMDSNHLEVLFEVPGNLHINCVFNLTKTITLLGTTDGIYSYSNSVLLKIESPDDIHYISKISDLNLAVMIASKQNILIQSDLNHLINLTQCKQVSKPTLNYQKIPTNSLKDFHLLQVSTIPGQHQFCAATSRQLAIFTYDPDLNNFIISRILDTAQPATCALFTQHSLLVGVDKFFEIDLKNFKAEEFLDNSDLNLGSLIKLAPMPLAIYSVGTTDIIEYLICFMEFTLLVDEYGRYSRPTMIKPTYLPIGYEFIRPFVYVNHNYGVEITKLNDSEEESAVSVNIDLKQRFSLVGHNKNGLYIWHERKIKFLNPKNLEEFNCLRDKSFESELTTATNSSVDGALERFSFTSSMVQSLDGDLSDCDGDDEEVGSTEPKRVHFSQTSL